MAVPPALHGAALLENGEVLVAGGVSPNGSPTGTNGSPTASAELYDPATGTWRSTGNMIYAADSQATRLQNGKILVPGGNSITAELYDPLTGKWTLTSNMYF